MLKNKFTPEEVKGILKTLVVIIDTKEQVYSHITDYLDSCKIAYVRQTVDGGDYTAYIPKNEAMGLLRDLYLPVAIERKNSVDELAQSIKDRTRFENEFLRASKANTRIYLLVEDADGYRNIIDNKYKSDYKPKALLGSLKSFEAKFNFATVFLNKNLSGHFILSTLYYQFMLELKAGELE